jgi:ubiquinone/menaquinone biosynthesis C-methylase UbiE
MDASGEFLIPGHFSELIESEHIARYHFASSLVHGKSVADIACGTGYGTRMLAEAGAKSVHGIDLSEKAIAFARKYYSVPNARFTVADAEELTSLGNQEFDLVVSFETIEHLANVEVYLDGMVRILRPGGQYLVSTPDRRMASVLHWLQRRPANRYHIHEYTRRDLLTLLAKRFRIENWYGQAFVPRWLVLFPVQFTIKAACRMLGNAKARDFKENLYSNQHNVKVIPWPGHHAVIAKFWVVLCTRP